MVEVHVNMKRVSQAFQDVVHRAQVCPKVHRTSVTHDVTRGRRANVRPRGRGKVEVERGRG